ncbi:DUF6538 domain-containing protein [Xanthomonas nasturtii]|uniref:Integrase n=1 Tax=Xanthomonas nasturtii TaxID=1843581 RepID=A0ABT0LVC7_9XANT|nr:DUF6538 domain-containing protein [Xanthomonas nasturtii]MCL1553290.1 integrase [Xanthomonas nasturtii]MCL1557378.1 integrase [Xanthomonas nasturtii]
MKLPHYLTRSKTGCYLFRMRVPSDLRDTLGRQFIKRSVGRDVLGARLAALELARRYAAAFVEIRSGRMGSGDRRIQELILERTRTASGEVVERWQMDNDDDVRLFRKATARIDYERDPLLAAAHGVTLPTPAAETVKVAESVALGRASEMWLKSLQGTTLPKTLTIKRTAVVALVAYLGAGRALHSVTRPDLARFYQHLRDGGAATPTLFNKQSYLGGESGFFAWAQASGHYPTDDNPARGHIRYTTKEKRQRKKLGFKAFDIEQVRMLYAPENFALLSPGARWAALLGLYTGARASEVGQLLTVDVGPVEGVPCVRICDEGEHQKLKTEVSNHVVPLHPELVGLGFLEYVENLRGRGDWRVFPQASATATNGAGNWISKAFGYRVGKVGKDWPLAKRGFQSLRKTVIQQMQTAGVPSELRAQIVGHELDDEHHATYSRAFTPAEKLAGAGASPGLSVLAYGLDLDALRPLLTASVSRRRAKTPGRKPSASAALRKRAATSGDK